MMLIAFTYTLDEIVELAAFPLRFLDDDLPGRQLHHIELEPIAAWGELNGQAIFARDQHDRRYV